MFLLTKEKIKKLPLLFFSFHSRTINEKMLKQWLESRTWTSTSAMQFQNFYDQAARLLIYGRAGHFQNATLPHLPSYHDQLSNNSNE